MTIAIVPRETSAPTEEEIRRAYRDRPIETLEYLRGRLADAIVPFTDPFDYHPADPDPMDNVEIGNEVWTNLRPSETAEIQGLLAEARLRVLDVAMEALEREIVDACLAFVERHPDVPRPSALESPA